MPEEITMPRLSDTMEEGTVARWHKKEGEPVEAGDLLAEIETDKAIMEFEAPEGGVLLKIVVPEGQPVAVGAPIAYVGEKGEKPPRSAAPPQPPAEALKPAEPPASPAPPSPPRAAAEPPPEEAPEPTDMPEGRVKASPLARRIAAERGIDLASVRGSGPGGRIVRADVQSAAPAGPAAKPATAAAPAGPPSPAPAGEITDLPLNRMRAVIAKRLLESKTTIPHFYEEMTIDTGPLTALRTQLNASLTDLKLSVNDFIVRAVALSLQRHPKVNASFAGTAIRYFGDFQVGVAVGIEYGLITPVVRNADGKTLRQISNEVKDLAARARERKLQPHEYQGGTFTVTNLGMFGIERFSAIINPPEAAILAVGATIEKPVVVEGRIEIGSRMAVVLSADHRVVDGVLAAEFLQTFRELMENPAGLVV